MLSGGLDTRSALATCPVELDCLNYSYFKNRESAAAEKSCQTVGQNIFGINYMLNIKFHKYSSIVNSSMYVVDVHYGHESIANNYDAIFQICY